MTNLLYLIPLALFLGGLGLAAFAWSLRSGQYDDLDGAAHRILFDDEDADTATPTSLPPSPAGGGPSTSRDDDRLGTAARVRSAEVSSSQTKASNSRGSEASA